jgi:Skp family chaperone for outer membrane proteins
MMKTTSLTIAGVAAIAALGAASVAAAQTKPAPKPAAAPASAGAAAVPPAPVFTGSAPGICVLSREGIVGASTVGKWVQTRLSQLQTQANAEITSDQTTLQNDAKSLDAKKSTLAQAAYQQQQQSLQQRLEALQQKAQQRDRELQATEQRAVQRVLTEASPLVNDQVKAKGCGVLLDGNSILGANPAMDLTPGVITALNAKITQFDFEREHLDAQVAPQQR